MNITCKSKRWGSMRCWRVSLKTTTFCLMKLFIADSSLCPGRLFSRLDWICLWSPAREVYQLSYNCSWELRRLSTDKWWEIQVMMLTFLIFRPYLVVWGTKTRPNSWPTDDWDGLWVYLWIMFSQFSVVNLPRKPKRLDTGINVEHLDMLGRVSNSIT